MTALVRGGNVLPHVQACADAITARIPEANSFGTYPGHEPTEAQACDCFVSVDTDAIGNQITDFILESLNAGNYGIWYMIYRQRIYNPSVANYWRNMEDRGSPTQNHMDHVHISFCDTGVIPGATNVPNPPATPSAIPTFPGITQQGSSGDAVRQVQQRLSDRGWTITVDSDFGPATKKVVMGFQTDKSITVDGIVGPVTWAHLWVDPIT